MAKMKDKLLLKTKQGSVSFTPEKLACFRDAFESAEDTIFVFEGKHYLKGYAKYIIEYMEGLWSTDDRNKQERHDG